MNMIAAIFRRFPLTSRFVLLVLAPLIAALSFGYQYLRTGLPPDHLTVEAPASSQSASIVRDENGVPHIVAQSETDAFYAIGYAHAQDRLWQLEVERRMVHGTLSEIFGKASLEDDVWFRTLGLYAAAKESWRTLSPAARRSLEAYAAGVNAGMAEQGGHLPVEFLILGVAPQPWTVYDSLGWMKIFALNLGGNFNAELRRLAAQQVLSPDEIRTLLPTSANDAKGGEPNVDAAMLQTTERILALQLKLRESYDLGGATVGSNAWVVAGKFTQDGGAMLANDPHLELGIPSPWYIVKARGGPLDVSGATLVGLPLVIFGKNATIAWGGTNLMADAQDLYFERTNPKNADEYEVDGHWNKFEIHEEFVSVRADFPSFLNQPYAPVEVQLRKSRHGPIISDQFGGMEQPIAMRWTALDSDDSSYEAFYRLEFSADWNAFKDALSLHVAPAISVVYADRAGNIGYLAAGRIPIRKQGDGSLPSPGWSSAYDWQGYIPSADLPQQYDPPAGYIVTANNRMVDEAYPYFISADWAAPSRAQRITELLQAKIDACECMTVEFMQQMQSDQTDVAARTLVERMKLLPATNESQRHALAVLAPWRGEMKADSAAAAIFQVWAWNLREQLFSARLRGFWNRQPLSRYLKDIWTRLPTEALARLLATRDSPWCGDVSSAHKSCDEILAVALDKSLEELSKLEHGETMEGWTLAGIQETVYTHVPFSGNNLLKALFERRISNGGSADTIDVAGTDFNVTEGFLQRSGPSFRQIAAPAASRERYLYINSTGESGNLVSPHYDDMIAPLRDATYHSLD